MIVPMKKLSLVILTKQRERALVRLRKAGIVHLQEREEISLEALPLLEKERQLHHSIRKLEEKGSSGKEEKILLPDQFDQLYERVLSLLDKQSSLLEELHHLNSEIQRVKEWGDYSLEDLKLLHEKGITLRFYTLSTKEIEKIDHEIPYIVLTKGKSFSTIATLNTHLGEEIQAQRFRVGEYSLSQLEERVLSHSNHLEKIDKELTESALHLPSFRHHLSEVEQQLRFERVKESMGEDEVVSWIEGFLPTSTVDTFKAVAKKEKWAYLLSDPSEEDAVPTQVKNKRWVSIIEPVFETLGTVPGYREYDISMWFLLFFALFFAMIIGDAAYGVIFLISAALLHKKMRRANNAVILLYVLSIATVVWGSLTGTWFGSKTLVSSLPFLKALVIPQIANYPEIFGIEAVSAQSMVMKFCFIVGTVQLSLACLINVHKKIGERDLSAVADVGWLIMLDALYFLVLMLVIGAQIAATTVVVAVLIGFLLILLFGAQGPNIPFVKGVLGGVANLFSTFLDTISAFSNIISYIRLFAVGTASLAIAQSFNSMASGMLQGFALPAGILVLVIGHTLNLVMALLSVVVHGVRLNLLEFSGQLGMEWTGVQYNPFKETVETLS